MKTANKLKDLIQATNGKFFSITFLKKDGTTRTINGKDKYRRLMAQHDEGQRTPAPSIVALREQGYASAIDRNKESWFCAHEDRIVSFKCGDLVKTF